MTLLVKFHMLMHSVARGFELASYTSSGAQAFSLVMLLLNLAFLEAIVHHHRVLHNPFCGRRIDVAHHRTVMVGLHAVRDAFLSGDSFAPPSSR